MNSLEDVRDSLVNAISLSEGIYHQEIGNAYLCLRTSQESKVTIKSFRRFDKRRFEASVREIGELGKYIEYIPSVVEFKDKLDDSVLMDVNLDLYEMLHRIKMATRQV